MCSEPAVSRRAKSRHSRPARSWRTGSCELPVVPGERRGGDMKVSEAVESRMSCRAFLPTPVSGATVRAILEGARRCPSGGNLQPWHVHVLAGAALAELRADIERRMADHPRGEGAEYDGVSARVKEPYRSRRFRCGEDLYAALGIPREDKAARVRQFARNYVFFDAPVGMFVSSTGRWVPRNGRIWACTSRRYAPGTRAGPAYLPAGGLGGMACGSGAVPAHRCGSHAFLRARVGVPG